MNKFIFGALATATALVTTLPALADQRDFTIINNNDLSIENIYISAANSGRWGRDWLRGYVLEAGDTFAAQFNNRSPQCLYDIRVVYEDGTQDIFTDENICKTTEIEFYGSGGDYDQHGNHLGDGHSAVGE